MSETLRSRLQWQVAKCYAYPLVGLAAAGLTAERAGPWIAIPLGLAFAAVGMKKVDGTLCPECKGRLVYQITGPFLARTCPHCGYDFVGNPKDL